METTENGTDWREKLEDVVVLRLEGNTMIIDRTETIAFIENLLKEKDEKCKSLMLMSVKLQDERVDELIREHKKELRTAINLSFSEKYDQKEVYEQFNLN